MQKKNDNVIKMPKQAKDWNLTENGCEISSLKKFALFKNANLVDIENNSCKLVDILSENGIIKKIEAGGKIEAAENCQVFDLDGDYVLPHFNNAFTDRRKVIHTDCESEQQMLNELMSLKDVLGGVLYFCDVDGPERIVIDDEAFVELDEKALSEISDFAAKNNSLVFLKVGQSLEALGSIDKKFGKSLPLVLEDFGFLDRRWVLVGGNCFEKDDLQILSEHGDEAVVCPSEDALCGRRPTNLISLHNKGFQVSIGSGSAFEVDFFAFMRQILMTHWGMFEDTNVLSEKDVFLMASRGASSFKEGGNATFIVVEKTPSLYCDLLKELVWGKSKRDVVMSVFEGRVLQYKGDAFSGISGFGQSQLIKEIIKKSKNKEKRK